jgi:hypothetical protein
MACLSCLVLLCALPASAAPPARLWPHWQQHDSHSTATIDHTIWDTFLQTYVIAPHPSGINRLRYAAVTPADRQALQRYVATMQAVPISTYNRREQMAYWINLYNAVTVHVVLAHYPVESIRDIDISPGLLDDGPWGAKLLTIEGEKVSLDDIEHRILRPLWQDNRVHYAVNCASLGCPNLAPVAYTAANLERLLEHGAREYVNHPRGVTFEKGELYVSSLYVWFIEDFGGDRDGILQHLRRYTSRPLVDVLQSYRGGLTFLGGAGLHHHYDWRLNAPEVPY